MKFINFKKEVGVIRVYNHKDEHLGYIEFYDKWKIHKQYIFIPDDNIFFTEGCLLEIIEKLKELNKQNKDGEVHKC